MLLRDYHPRSQLVTAKVEIERPRFPVVDAHNHLGGNFGGGWINRPVEELIEVMDQAEVEILVDLDGGWGEDILERHLDHFKARAPDRFIHFGGVDWDPWPNMGNQFSEWAAARFRDQVHRGAGGLKIWKGFGLSIRDDADMLVAVDDPRLDPIWETAADLGVPVVIHVADPVAFFESLNHTNERWEELNAHPEWHSPSPPFPNFISIIESLARLVLRHAETTFIGAHVGCYAENLGWVSDLLERAPNFYVDIGARIAELGRQPYASRKFFLQYPDRILFGTDMPANVERYHLHYRFLESDDEYFNYDLEDPPTQGRWRIYGLDLPDEVLQKVYYENAYQIFHIGN
ncbi:MAG TPA: amidohydrolase family protein [Anaerolineae bacterium]|nr:amidohydrolase family protein [Anaerolineae bacterium]